MISKRPTLLPDSVERAKWIALTQGYFALIDEEDYESVSKNLWTTLVRKNPYSAYAFRVIKNRPLYLHRFVMNPPSNMDIDHIDGNGLNCRKENLRICTHGSNMHNYTKPNGEFSSQHKGVTWDKSRDKWLASIKIKGKRVFLGRYDLEIVAAQAYNSAALRLFGEFAKINIIH